VTEQRSEIQERPDAAAVDLARADAIVTDADLVPMWVAHLSQAMESLDKAGHLIDTFRSSHEELEQFLAAAEGNRGAQKARPIAAGLEDT
jgi:hypothetical protein